MTKLDKSGNSPKETIKRDLGKDEDTDGEDSMDPEEDDPEMEDDTEDGDVQKGVDAPYILDTVTLGELITKSVEAAQSKRLSAIEKAVSKLMTHVDTVNKAIGAVAEQNEELAAEVTELKKAVDTAGEATTILKALEASLDSSAATTPVTREPQSGSKSLLGQAISKAIIAEPGVIAAPDDVDANGLSASDREAAAFYYQKAIVLRAQENLPTGLADYTNALVDGTVTKFHVEALKKGVEAAEGLVTR